MKIAIVGAGICGLYLAWKLAENGNEVTIFEKKEKIGKEACSGLFSEKILRFIPESKKLVQNKMDSVLIHFPKRTVRIRFAERFLVMTHFKLDNLVAELARQAGVKIILNHNVTKQDLVTLQNNFERVIGCDGANSCVRKSLGLKNPEFYLGIQGFLFKKDSSDQVETWSTKSGFLWRIPMGREIEYGIIEKPDRARKIFEEFLRKKEIQLERLNPVEEFRQPRSFFEKSGVNSRSESKFLDRVNSAIIPQGLIFPKNPKVTLCGDAAGLTKPWSGGGVIWGLMAADLLLKNFPDFLKYKKAAEKFFLVKILFSKAATKLVYFLGFKAPWLLKKEFKIESDFLIKKV